MSKINQLAEKFGIDKTLHFLVGALSVSYGMNFSFTLGIIAFAVIMFLEYYKEKKLDSFFSVADVKATFYGCLLSFSVGLISLFV